MTYDDATKLACIDREIKMRHRVYPGRVRNGLMSALTSAHEIAVMEAIAADYRDKVQPSLELP
jgi:hypothetical protein